MKKIIVLIVILNLVQNVNVNGQYLNWAWAKGAGGGSTGCSIYPNSTTTDIYGNVYVTGHFYGTNVAFGPYTLTDNGGDLFFIKYDSEGNVIWAKSAGGNHGDDGRNVTTDSNGNIYLSGTFGSSMIIFDSDTLINNSTTAFGDMFIVKYDNNGNVIWAKSAGGLGNDEPYSAVTDTAGNVYVVGIFASSPLNIGPYTFSALGNWDIFIVKYDSNGSVVWAKSIGTPDTEVANSINIDNSGNLYIVGHYNNPSITFDTTTLTSAGLSEMFIVKYDTNGNQLWAKSVGGIGHDYANSVSTDSSGNVFVVGQYSSPSLSFGTINIMNMGVTPTSDIFIVKYDSVGNEIWAKSAGGAGYDGANSVDVDSYGNAYVTGGFEGASITFNSYTLNNQGDYDVFLTKYDSNGNAVWAKSVGNVDYEESRSVALDLYNNIYLNGRYKSDTIVFDTTMLLYSGYNKMFISKIDSTQMRAGIREIPNHISPIELYPNPTTGELRITNYELRIKEIKMFNVLGCEILKQVQNDQHATIDISAFASGIYFAEIKTEKGIVRKKVVKE